MILDLGANNGASTRWFVKEFPEAHVIAVEPDADNARVCRLNTETCSVDVVVAAIGGSPGHVSIDTENKGSVSYTTARGMGGQIPVVTVQDLVTNASADDELFIVKIDIEGFEEDLFSANTEWIEDVCVIMIEPHDFKFPERATSQAFQRAIAGNSFQVLLSGENLIYVRID